MGDRPPNRPIRSRRALLAAAAGGVAALSGCWSGGPSPDTTPTGDGPPRPTETPTTTATKGDPADNFETVLDAIDDVGCDPSGEDPCGTPLEEAFEDGVAVRFPAGRYRFDRPLKLHNYGRVGFIGDGDVRFVPPEGFNDKLIWYIGFWAHFSGIDIDLRAPETTAGLRFITFAGFNLEDVEFLGRGTHPAESVTNALSIAVSNKDKVGIVRDLRARRGSAIGHYKGGNGRVGIWIGNQHNGHIRVEDSRLEEFGNNGIYASRCLGTTEVVGGVFRNNNTCCVRLGGAGNVIRGATFELDLSRYSGPTTRQESDYNTRAIVTEQGPFDKAGRVLIDDCDIRILDVDRSQGGVVAWPTGNGPRLENCRIETRADWVVGVRGMSPGETIDPADRAVELVDTTIVGDAANGSAVELRQRPNTLLQRTTIDQSGAARDGIQLLGANPVRLADSSVTTTRYPLFAVDPVTAGDDCLVYLWGESTVESSGPVPRTLRRSEVAMDDDPPDPGFSVPEGVTLRCAGRAILDGLDDPKAVGITEVADDGVSWTHHASIETAVRR